MCWTKFLRYLQMCLEEHRVGCHDGAKGTCLVRWGAEYSEEHWERLLEKVDQHRRREPSSTDPVSSCECEVPLVGVVQSCCPVCGLLAIEQAHLLLLTSVAVLILATAVKEFKKSHLKSNCCWCCFHFCMGI